MVLIIEFKKVIALTAFQNITTCIKYSFYAFLIFSNECKKLSLTLKQENKLQVSEYKVLGEWRV
jgi:hypothetical protein